MLLPSYMVPLAQMNEDGPGSLDVVFGWDGCFEGAPIWTGPIWCVSRSRWVSWTSDGGGAGGDAWRGCQRVGESGITTYDLSDLALDCRVFAVCNRLALLGAHAFSGISINVNATWQTVRNFDSFTLIGVERHSARVMVRGRWSRLGRWMNGDGVEEGPDLPIDRDATVYDFTAALTLALAPKIAKLDGFKAR